MQNQKFVIKVPSTSTIQTDGITSLSSQFDGTVSSASGGGSGNENVVVYCWDMTIEDIVRFGFSSLTPIVGHVSGVVTKIELEFYTYHSETSSPIISIDIVNITGDPNGMSAATLFNAVKAAASAADNEFIQGDTKRLRTILVAEDDSVCDTLKAAMNGPSRDFFSLGIRKHNTSSDGQTKVGGQILAYGVDTEWAAPTANEIDGPPNLIIHIEQTPQITVQHSLKYTSVIPYDDQTIPLDSLGGFFSSNSVYKQAQIGDPITPTQTYIPISSDADSEMPSSSGLAQIGPEILLYQDVDIVSRFLRNVKRGIVPKSHSSSSSVYPYAEFVYYLDPSKIFDNRPISGFSQYRCLAVQQVSPITNTDNVKIFLIQNSNTNVDIDIGIEVPRHNIYSSVTSDNISSGDTILVTSPLINNFSDNQLDSGFFNNSAIRMVGDNFASVISNYVVVDDTTAEIHLSTPFISDYASGSIFYIDPAPSQIIDNEITPPVDNGRFFGFLGDGGSNDLSFNDIQENAGALVDSDVFYLWIKRTLKNNKKQQDDTGAVIVITFEEA